jgi:drug/metabolite transporter (DMT)-like permease
MQWASVFLLTIGCIIKEINHSAGSTTTTPAPSPQSPDGKDVALAAVAGSGILPYLDYHLVFILLQVFCSCFAGVYNEYLLKDTGCEVHIMMSNLYMYLQSVLCNVVVLAFQGELLSAFTADSFRALGQPSVLAIIANNACVGIVTSLFLCSLNSILKTFASALELMFTAVLCWLIFGIPIDGYTLLALVIVISATFLYAQNPIVNKARNDPTASSTESKV